MALGKSLQNFKVIEKQEHWEDNAEWLNFTSGKTEVIRPVGLSLVLATHWVRTANNKVYPTLCPQFDPMSEEYVKDRCCPLHDDFELKAAKSIYMNVIVRKLQEKGMQNPVRLVKFPYSVNASFQSIIDYIKTDPADPENGIELIVKYDDSQAGSAKWNIQRGDRAPLTAEEKAYDLFDWEEIGVPDYSDPEKAEAQAREIKSSLVRNLWYVKKTENGTFKGDANGRPYYEFPELESAGVSLVREKDTITVADYNNSIQSAGGGNTSAKKVKVSLDDDDDDLPPPTKKAVTEEAPKKVSLQLDDDDEVVVAPKKEAKAAVEETPDCFAKYDGSRNCLKCPMKVKCIDLTPDD